MGIQSRITIKIDGDTHELELNEDGGTILEAAMDSDIDIPFSCQGGICTTCMAKVTEGKVKMDSNFALSDKEIADGYVLSCQSHPTTEKVTLEFE